MIMKRTFQASIAGRIYNIEEDAYSLLLDYLESLSQVFKGAEGAEIVADIEGRIGEIFSERADRNGHLIVTIEDVNTVIETMGQPADIADGQEYDSSQTPPPHPRTQAAVPPPGPTFVPKKCYRCANDRVLGGVLSGLGTYLGWNINMMRVLLVVLGFFTGFFPLFVIYCILWMVIPLAKTPEQQLEQLGQPATLSNIGNMVAADSRRGSGEMTFFQILGNILMGFVGLVSGCVGFALIVGLTVMIGVLIGEWAGLTAEWLPDIALGTDITPMTAGFMPRWFIAVGVMTAMLIPCIALVWAACSVLFKTKGASRTTWIIGIIIEVLAIAGCIFCGSYIMHHPF